MIILQIQGGLGNQMFQYATGRTIALNNKTRLKWDLSLLENDINKRRFRLDQFNINASNINGLEKKLIYSKNSFYKALRKRVFNITKVVEDFPASYNKALSSIKGNVILNGFWQFEDYFKDIRQRLIRELTIKKDPTPRNSAYIEQIQSENSVAIHFRRGDYVSNNTSNAFHGVCPLDYYLNAINCLKHQLKNLSFFIFSDDPEWVKTTLKIPDKTSFIDHNRSDEPEDFRLMVHCKHHIIANSSFSWWGAWLCTNPDRRVIAPKQWFRDKLANENHILPKDWIRL